MTDLLITRLSSIRGITVRPTNAVLGLANSEAISIGGKLNVDAVLEGTIYRTTDNLRVTARLVKVSDGSPMWNGHFEKSLREELRIQNEIALQILDALSMNLSRSEIDAVTKRYTENADAYQLYVKGRYEWRKRSWAGMNEAQRLFRNAIERDPAFALAYVGLADTMAINADQVQALNAVQKAIELDPNLAEAHASLGFIQIFHQWEWREAETSLKKSIELNPNYATAHHWYAQLLAIEGRNAEAKAAMRRALEINPLSFNFFADLGQIYYFDREYSAAESYCHKALEIYPDFGFALDYLHDIYLKTGDYDKAVEAEINAKRVYARFAEESAAGKQMLESSLNNKREIYQAGGIKKFLESLIGSVNEPAHQYVYATRYAFLGDKQKALDNLEKAVEGRAFLSAFIKADPV
ncbi:MAG: tetratricopeptide repeat protein, partial [Acidobacteria bacterium]|nr:tetratricopeptide repeat protein [Acidobacteriota bacterium]